ncbi:MAG: alpha-amylase [Gemmatimonadaceae bacterium]|nr:alpha-amylase [Chitinophagaceae bacterium]
MNNQTLFQFFHWYYPSDGSLWNHCAEQAEHLKWLGITRVWLPPAYKSANGQYEPGYAVYDLFDLGEFDQKGTIPTKYGTKDEYLKCIDALHSKGIGVAADIVLNHKLGADEKETVTVIAVDDEDRHHHRGEKHEAEVYTKFTFPGRKGKYSEYVWDWHSFTGAGGTHQPHTIYSIISEYGEDWEEMVDDEKGNFDYLMGSDIEFRNPHVRDELRWWGQWYLELTKIDGLRLDAVKHITPSFFVEWLDFLRNHFQKDIFCVAEYWHRDVNILLKYLSALGDRTQLFDVPLHFNFYLASLRGNEYDLRTIFDNTLVQVRPDMSVTFVDNHDTQPLQSLESTVDYWFKPLAYALILLREQGIPCVFYAGYYGAKYNDIIQEQEVNVDMVPVQHLSKMLVVRKNLAYGMQRDYFDHPNTIGWTREGNDDMPESGCAVLITNGTAGEKSMEIGNRHANKTFIDITGGREEKVIIDENGFATFFVNDASVSVWIEESKATVIN